jgi:hypothetical protein
MKNRNIITKHDLLKAKEHPGNEPLDARAGVAQAAPPAADDYMDRLMKFIPVETVGLYTIIEVNLKSLYNGQNLGPWLLGLLIFGMIATVFYVRFYLKVKRWIQVLMTDLGFAVWVFTIGGWFGTMSFWKAEWGIIAAVIYLFIIKIIRLEPIEIKADS